MKAYGIPRIQGEDDVDGIQRFARKGSYGRIGRPRPYVRNAEGRRSVRRIWKKKERAKIRGTLQQITLDNGCHSDYIV